MNPSPSREPFSSPEIIESSSSKRRRRPAGTPDPDAEVVSLSPKTLLESDRFVCEICNQGFQRDQNLQMHRRRHKVPWKLLKREAPLAARKRVYVCPEPSCLHHDPGHALGDLVGIKKHFRRKHSTHKQWLCDKCCKGYAVQSDYKAHLKTCGTRGHSCDCGRVFSRVESFIEHQDVCSMGRLRSERNAPPPPPPPCLSQSASSDNNAAHCSPNLELQLLTSSSEIGEKTETGNSSSTSEKEEQLRMAVAEKAYAEEVRRQVRWQIDVAEEEFAKAKKIRQQAQAELEKAQVLKEEATKRINCSILEITCHSCKHRFQATSYDQNSSSSLSYVSAALREWGVRRFDLN